MAKPNRAALKSQLSIAAHGEIAISNEGRDLISIVECIDNETYDDLSFRTLLSVIRTEAINMGWAIQEKRSSRGPSSFTLRRMDASEIDREVYVLESRLRILQSKKADLS